MRPSLYATMLFGCLVAVGCGMSPAASGTPSPTSTPTLPMPSTPPLLVLLLSATAGFRHDSIASARTAFAELAATTGEFTVAATEDVSSITAERLGTVDVLAFVLTTGELPFDATQQAAILAFIERGGGFLGFHSATDTLYTWPAYGALVGAYFREHPWTRPATVVVEDRQHPAAAGLVSFSINEEFYTFRENPRPRVQVLMSLDASSVGASGDFPLVWVQSVGAGRAYYNALGHFAETWSDARFRSQIRAAVAWVGRR